MYAIFQVVFFCMDVVYFFIKLCPTKHKVVYLSRQDNKPSTDFLLIDQQLKKDDPTYTSVFLCRKIEGGIGGKIKYVFHMLEQMYHIATSETAVTDTYCIVLSCLHHKKDLKVIQTWHGLGAFKKFAYQIIGKGEGSSLKLAKAMHMHEKYDYVLTSSLKSMPHFMEAFNVPKEKMVIAPLPKVDLLRDKNYQNEIRNEILAKHPEIKNKECVLYVPTFRKDETKHAKMVEDLINNFDFDKYNLIFSLHPLSKITYDDERIITDRTFQSFQWATVCNKVITDYSAVAYELAIMNKQIYYYVFDREDYDGNRGFYTPLDQFPGPKCLTAIELMQQLNKEDYDSSTVKKFTDDYIDPTITNCSGKISEIIRTYPVNH